MPSRVTSSASKAALKARERFLRRISPETPAYQLFDCLPDVAFFAKDRNFRLICASQRFLDRFGFRSEAQVIGQSDFDLFPPRLAESFRRDDEAVVRTGEPNRNIVELFFNEQGVPDWYITHKFPVRDARGEIMGLMGISHTYESRREVLHRDLQLNRAIAYIRDHFRSGVSIKELAHAVHISPRQLHRKFVEAFGVSPQTFLIKLRIQAACEMLQRQSSQISEVAQDLRLLQPKRLHRSFPALRRHHPAQVPEEPPTPPRVICATPRDSWLTTASAVDAATRVNRPRSRPEQPYPARVQPR